jgi:hypothetical protein
MYAKDKQSDDVPDQLQRTLSTTGVIILQTLIGDIVFLILAKG